MFSWSWWSLLLNLSSFSLLFHLFWSRRLFLWCRWSLNSFNLFLRVRSFSRWVLSTRRVFLWRVKVLSFGWLFSGDIIFGWWIFSFWSCSRNFLIRSRASGRFIFSFCFRIVFRRLLCVLWLRFWIMDMIFILRRSQFLWWLAFWMLNIWLIFLLWGIGSIFLCWIFVDTFIIIFRTFFWWISFFCTLFYQIILFFFVSWPPSWNLSWTFGSLCMRFFFCLLRFFHSCFRRSFSFKVTILCRETFWFTLLFRREMLMLLFPS